ncbi:MAG: hypothetical protein IKW90_01310 [Lachnospiraceae bacterium]|nr:hypothetical protein [Lachnospiraceae bacterium]
MKKLLFLLVTLIIGGLFPVSMLMPETKISAEEIETDVIIDEDEPYALVRSASCCVSISSGTATVSSSVTGENGVSSTSLTVYLEKFVAGSWQPYMSWSHSGGAVQGNTDSTSVSSGAYRVWMSVTATGTDGTESFNVDGNTAGC